MSSARYLKQSHLQGYQWVADEVEPFSDSRRVLDIGCGTGWFLEALRARYPTHTLVGLDMHHDLNPSNFEFVTGCGNRLPFNGQSFDGVSCKAVLEHLQNPLEALCEINRVLRYDGVLLISVPSIYDRHFWDDYTHIRPFTEKSLRTLLADGGFRVNKLWHLSSIPGAGVIMRKLGITRQSMLKFFASLGIFRTTINAVAQKSYEVSDGTFE